MTDIKAWDMVRDGVRREQQIILRNDQLRKANYGTVNPPCAGRAESGNKILCEGCLIEFTYDSSSSRWRCDNRPDKTGSSICSQYNSHCGILSHNDIHPDPLAGRNSNNYNVFLCDRCFSGSSEADMAPINAVIAKRFGRAESHKVLSAALGIIDRIRDREFTPEEFMQISELVLQYTGTKILNIRPSV